MARPYFWQHEEIKEINMTRYRKHKEHLIEKLKNSEYAAAYLTAALEESYDCSDPSLFQVAVRDVVEARGGVGAISAQMDVNRESFYRSLSSKGKVRFSTLINAIKACGFDLEFHPAH